MKSQIRAAQVALITFIGLNLATLAQGQGASFPSVWSQVQEGEYLALPTYHTALSEFFSAGVDLLKRDANRTLNDDSDIRAYFQKLVHPVGICFSGTWEISEQSPYTGYFAEGAKGQIIVRASEALGNAEVGDWRAFGLAGKIFPTQNPDDQTPYQSANFFTVDDLGGTDADSFLDLAKLNEPKTSFHFGSVVLIPLLAKIASTFSSADSNPGIRQTYPIAELGMANPSQARAPHWMALQPENTERNGQSDFRNELRLSQFPDGLTFGILVAEEGQSNWKKIGRIHLTEEALSEGCDHRLHFQHPKHR